MANETDAIRAIKTLAKNVIESAKLGDLIFGSVKKLSPLRVQIDQKLVVEGEELLLTDNMRSSLQSGDELLLIRQSGGQLFFIAENLTHDASGGDGPQGPPGPKGDTGDKGPKGDKGDKGDQGNKGDAGDTGPVGATGAVGPAGPTGQAGATGEPGPAGATGAPGPKGNKGDKGDQGPSGSLTLPMKWGDLIG
jgi:hypothetical protein